MLDVLLSLVLEVFNLSVQYLVELAMAELEDNLKLRLKGGLFRCLSMPNLTAIREFQCLFLALLVAFFSVRLA